MSKKEHASRGGKKKMKFMCGVKKSVIDSLWTEKFGKIGKEGKGRLIRNQTSEERGRYKKAQRRKAR